MCSPFLVFYLYTHMKHNLCRSFLKMSSFKVLDPLIMSCLSRTHISEMFCISCFPVNFRFRKNQKYKACFISYLFLYIDIQMDDFKPVFTMNVVISTFPSSTSSFRSMCSNTPLSHRMSFTRYSRTCLNKKLKLDHLFLD